MSCFSDKWEISPLRGLPRQLFSCSPGSGGAGLEVGQRVGRPLGDTWHVFTDWPFHEEPENPWAKVGP